MSYEQTGLDGQIRYYEKLGEGPINEYGYTGDTMGAVSADSPGPELIAGCQFSDERVALALRVNYTTLVSPRFVGGAPVRLDIEKTTKEFFRIQNKIHRPHLNRIRNVTLFEAINRGVFKPTYRNKKGQPIDLFRGRFMFPIDPSVDSFYDVKEEIQSLRSGLTSPQEIAAKTNRNWDIIRRQKKEAAIQIAMDAEDANDTLVALGYKPSITANDLMQLTDNPQEKTPAGQDEPKPEKPVVAQLNCGTGKGGFQSGNTCAKGGESLSEKLSRTDSEDITPQSLGLPYEEWKGLSGATTDTRETLSVSDIKIGRPELSKKRILMADKKMESGFKSKGVMPIYVIPSVEKGKYVVSADGNHRIASLLLTNPEKKIEVVVTR